MSNYSHLASYAVSLVINLTIVGTCIAAGLALSFLLVRQLSPRVRYVIAVTAFVAAVVLPIYSTLRISVEPTDTIQIPIDWEQSPSSIAAIPARDSKSPTNDSHETSKPDEAPFLRDELRPTSPPQIGPFVNHIVRISAESWLGVGSLCLWGFVVALLLGRDIFGYIHLARARHTWRLADTKVIHDLRWPSAYPLFISEHDGPCTVGLARPAVVIPASLLGDIPLGAARLIARHELAHARWRDPLVNALLRIIRALLWPSLPLHFIGRIARIERETAADVSAVASSEGDINGAALEYATLLVQVARRSSTTSTHWKYRLAATEAGSRIDLESRVARLLEISSRPTCTRTALATFALVATAWVSCSLPVAARPIAFTPGSSIIDAGRVEESKAASTDQEASGGAGADLGSLLAAQGKSWRPTLKDESILNYVGPEAVRAATGLPSDHAQEQAANGALRTLTPQTATPSTDDMTRDFENEMAALGYTNLSPDQLASMKAYGVSQTYIKEMAASGYSKLTADALINFRWLGIDPAYIKEMRTLGYNDLSANTLIDFRLYGITPSYINAMAALGLANLPAKTLVAFRRLGVSEGYVRGLKAQGHENLTADRFIDMLTQKVAVDGSRYKE